MLGKFRVRWGSGFDRGRTFKLAAYGHSLDRARGGRNPGDEQSLTGSVGVLTTPERRQRFESRTRANQGAFSPATLDRVVDSNSTAAVGVAVRPRCRLICLRMSPPS